MAEKVYLLADPAAPEELGTLPMGQPVRKKERPAVLETAIPAIEPEADAQPESWIKLPAAARRPHRPMAVLLAAYALGGVAPLLLRAGARKFLWASFTLLSVTCWVALFTHRDLVMNLIHSGRMPLVPFLGGFALMHLLGALSWSRGLRLAARDERFVPERLPEALRHPMAAAAIGLALPGYALVIGKRAWRAAFALWNAASVVLATLVLANAGMLWSWNKRAGVDALPRTFLEGVLVASAFIAVIGALAWVATALDGGRSLAAARRMRSHRHPHLRSDAILAGLVGSAAVFALTFSPTGMAADLDRFAGALRFSGYRLIPLSLESAAMRLDPARSEYAIRAAELHLEMGHRDAASVIQQGLRARWETYAQMLLREQATSQPKLRTIPIRPSADLAPNQMDLGMPAGTPANPTPLPAPVSDANDSAPAAPKSTLPAPAATPPAL
jgi:hypothetical protein